ncbi:MAG: hypothetical protein KatS3mg105_1660 [Gemmatales bacterium]|nr:MAG: hypothetical protein KatS3mg105_1660 [Gemmatales bacterium]
MEGKQREKALLSKSPRETAVQLRDQDYPGIAVAELSADQKALVEKTLQDILKPYRKEDVDEVLQIVKAGGGLDKIHISFYSDRDLQNDKVWDVWRLEGPTLVCHFRGATARSCLYQHCQERIEAFRGVCRESGLPPDARHLGEAFFLMGTLSDRVAIITGASRGMAEPLLWVWLVKGAP